MAAGTRFGAYEVTGLLGRGGMATVYLAQDHKHHRTVAVKVFDAGVGAAMGREWFLREIDIAAGLHHPHILPLHDSGEVDGRLYYVMPHVEGESLRQRLTREGQIPLASARRIIQEVAGALDYAHRQHVVHRDIKPENILLQEGQAIVADFGIARALDPVVVDTDSAETIPALGTPAYMSPEQATRTAAIDGRTDIYALGCVLYEMLAGAPPFTGATVQAILDQHAAAPVPSLRRVRPDIPLALEQAVTRALEKVPADRFATASEFAKALDMAVSATTLRRPGFRLRWRGVLLGVAAAAVLTAGVEYFLRRPPDSTGPNPDLVAILPFRTAGASPELAWLREGMVDLLTLKLAGEGGLRAVEPRTLLSAWSRAGGSAGREIAVASAMEIARHVGAGRILDGSVVGTTAHVTLSASLLTIPRGSAVSQASVEGPIDSLSALVDLLAARVLSLQAGTETSRLPSLMSVSLPAIHAYLAGRAAFRRGRFDEAFERFRDATVIDSNFAVAALELVHASIWTAPAGEAADRGKRLALAGRNQLGPGDRALIDIWARPVTEWPELFRSWRAAANAYPGRAEVWYGLGDAYYHHGARVGLAEPFRLAADAFRRGWIIDSTSGDEFQVPDNSPALVEPINHLVEMAQVQGDTLSVRRLVALGLASDSTSFRSDYLRWHAALAAGDSARRAFWADSQRLHVLTVASIHRFTGSSGVGMEDYLRSGELMLPHWEAGDSAEGVFERSVLALNGGRPSEAASLMRGHLDAPDGSMGLPIGQALYWGGSRIAAVATARRLTRIVAAGVTGGLPLQWQLQSLCALATWRAARGDYAYTEIAVRRLRSAVIRGLPPDDSVAVANFRTLCVALLDATRATALHLVGAPGALDRADTAALTYNVGVSMPPNLVIARLAEAQGDLPRALRAVRRGSGYDLFPLWYLSTFLHEEGRLAALTGDTAGAIRAYQHYLALRPDPEPEVKPEVERVRVELGKLKRQRGS
ncbi:MAG TPA: serine/threonine-protein kinase [Gemmatimonadales bacterium]|nr:serine/threonine-protein kinase [Gemmatimonadales bacterium]